MDWQKLAEFIARQTGEAFVIKSQQGLAGGCINSAFRIQSSERSYFVKTNHASTLNMFIAEAEGLRELQQADAVRVPAPIGHALIDDTACLVLEYLDLSGRHAAGLSCLGEALAKQHRYTAAQFGWRHDNTIGSTPQVNTQSHNWVGFWQQHRLGYQLQLAQRNGIASSVIHKGERLQQQLTSLLDGHTPPASLLHGDLWGGNHALLRDGTPVIFDPAVYYGDREADLAMTELFGGFGEAFYAAYRQAWPLLPGYEVRKQLYNLYHVLNHYNLFGGGYARQAEHMIDRLLAELR